MDGGSNQFRGAAFGGFNRQDVLSYLATVETEHESITTTLRSELEETQNARTEDRKRLKEAETSLEQERKRTANLEEELEKSEEARKKSDEALQQAQDQIKQLRAFIADLEPKAIAYGRIKERAAAIELDAHERAQETLDQAKQEVAVIQQDCIRWIQEVQAGYERLRSGLNETFVKSTIELELICKSFDRITQEFDGHEDMMLEIRSKVEDMKIKIQSEAR